MNGAEFKLVFQPLPQGPNRVVLADPYRQAGLVLDQRRDRPRYFDGRVLTAGDLHREQGYFQSRQALLGRTLGSGVAEGLLVEALSATSLRLGAGHGLTPSGDLITIEQDVELELADLATAELLSGAFGLRRLPQAPGRGRSGLFVLVLRPLEFTANPIASYPTSVEGRRSFRDGDVVEATGISLVPFPASASLAEPGGARARLAREIFVQGARPGTPAGVLPVAMMELDRGLLRWLDPFLVRRWLSLGDDEGELEGSRDGVSLSTLRQAALWQYRGHLADVVTQRSEAGRPARFPATEHFRALPAAGPLPPDVVDTGRLSQIFFPPEIGVELAIVPEDEVPVMVEEALALPPIDLGLPGPELAAVSVLIAIPVPRYRLPGLLVELQEAQPQLSGSTAAVREGGPVPETISPSFSSLALTNGAPSSLTRLALPSVSSGAAAIFAPIGLNLRLPSFQGTTLLRPALSAAWQHVLASADELWYVRRRTLARSVDLAGVAVDLRDPDLEMPARLEARLRDFGQLTRYREVRPFLAVDARLPFEELLLRPYMDYFLPLQGVLEFTRMLGGLPESVPLWRVLEMEQNHERVEAIQPIAEILEEHADLFAPMKYARFLIETYAVPQLLLIHALLRSDPQRLEDFKTQLKEWIDSGAMASNEVEPVIYGFLQEVQG